MNITLTQSEYEGLIALARMAPVDQLALNMMLEEIEKTNGIKRYLLWVQWQDAAGVVPIGMSFPETWPAELRAKIEQVDVPINRQQVEDMVALRANKPIGILVTPDPNATLGWSTLDQWFAVQP